MLCFNACLRPSADVGEDSEPSFGLVLLEPFLVCSNLFGKVHRKLGSSCKRRASVDGDHCVDGMRLEESVELGKWKEEVGQSKSQVFESATNHRL